MDWQSLLVGGGISLVATGIVAYVFYWLASKDLKDEAAELRRLNLQLVYLLDSADVIHVSKYDVETGEPVEWMARKSFDTLRRVKASEAKEPLEPPSDERDAPETVEQEPEEAQPRSDAPGAQEGIQRPWWRRVFGG